MAEIHELLKELDACDESQEWASVRTWEQIYNECYRGDWLCWLFARTNPDDIQLLTLVKGHQANTVRHLMKDERSRATVDAAIAFGEGRITLDELKIFANAATDATDTATDDAAAYAAAYAAETAADTDTSESTEAAANAVNAAYYAESEVQNMQETADIFRKFIPIEKFKI